MLFKKPLTLILSSILCLSTLAGCSYFFGEKEKVKEVVFTSDHDECLTESTRVLKRYFEDYSEPERAQEESIELGLCYQKAIDAFVKFTKSGDEVTSAYSAEKFEQFFNRFYPQMGINLTTIKGYIEFKQFLLGGEKDQISKNELRAIHQLLPAIAQTLKDLAPYRAILLDTTGLTRDASGRSQFNEAFAVLKDAAGVLLHKLKPWKGQRSLDLTSVGQFLVNEYFADDLENKLPYVDLMIQFKNLTLNENHAFLRRVDFEMFVIQLLKTYEALSEFNYFVKEDKFFSNIGIVASFIVKIPSQLSYGRMFQSETLPALLKIFEIVQEVMDNSAKRSSDGIVNIDRVNDFLLEMEKAKLMQGPLAASTLGYFIKKFSQKWLISNNARVGENLDREKIAYLRSVINQWSRRQKMLNEAYRDQSSLSLEDLVAKAGQNFDLTLWLNVYKNIALHQWSTDGKVTYSADTSEFNYEEMTVANSLYSLVSVFMKPYSLDQNLSTTYRVRIEDAQEIYELLRILGIDLAFVDARILTTGEKSFLEGNNFSTQKRNDDVLDFYEAYELMSITFSSGMVAESIYKDIPESCRLDYKDVLKSHVLKADCFRQRLAEKFGEYFSQLESFSKYWQSASELDKNKFLGVLEVSARNGVISKKPFDLGELRVMVGTMYYLEAVFYNFDYNTDGLANGSEILDAEAQFRPLVTKFIVDSKKETIESLQGLFDSIPDWIDGGQTGEQQMKDWAPAIFMYILATGSVPEGTWSTLDFLGSRNAYERWANNNYVNHGQVLRVFAALAKTTAKKHFKEVYNFLDVNKETLFADMQESDVPDCRKKDGISFCKWARLIYCNETVNGDLYDWMKLSEPLIFPNEEWEQNRSGAINEALHQMSRVFRSHKLFSTQCAFPEIGDPNKGLMESIQEAGDSFWNGSPTDKGVWESVQDYFGWGD